MFHPAKLTHVAFMLGCGLLLTAAGRPSGQLVLDWQLNGQAERWTLPDGGASGLFASSGQACAPLAGGSATPSVILLVPETPTNLCIRPTTTSPDWDGGCNTIDTDVNFGVPLQPWVPQRILLEQRATSICGASDAGIVRVPLWILR